MQWIGALLVLSLLVGLRRKAGAEAHAILVLGIAAIVAVWYVQLGQGG